MKKQLKSYGITEWKLQFLRPIFRIAADGIWVILSSP